MGNFFLTLLNMSLVSCWLIIALLILRPLLKKAPKAFVCALWGLVGLRLVCPFTVESFLSLIPTSDPISKEAILTRVTNLGGETQALENTTTIISNTLASPAGASINPMQAISLVAAFIWAVGVAVMLIISLVSYLRLNKTVSPSINTGGNVFIADGIASPFVLGIIKPRIYIPSTLTEYEKEYVIAHENAHIKRRDYLLKPIGYIILSLHWFNPLVWVAYILLCRDIESACDERVISKMDDKGKKEYSEVLLRLSLPSAKLRACPVAFGEVGVKSRIKSVLSYKKPTFWIVIAAAVLTVALSVCFLTNPVKAEEQTEVQQAETFETAQECISNAIVSRNKTENAASRFCAENYVEISTVSENNFMTVYIWAYYGEFEKSDSADSATLAFESYKPAKVRIIKGDDSYKLQWYSTTDERKDTGWVTASFPEELQESALYTPGYYNDQKSAALELAKEHFGIDKKSNEFLPAFNAEVVEVSEKYITVAPLKGETVSGKTLDKVRLNTHYLSSTSPQPLIGDMVRVRYVDIITFDTNIPTLTNVYNLEILKSKTEVSLPAMIYSGDDNTSFYIKEPDNEKVYVYRSGNAEVWQSGTYFSINEEQQTFMLLYDSEMSSDGSEETGILTTGTVEFKGDELILHAEDAATGTLCFLKEGDSYIFSWTKTCEYSGEDGGFPFDAGDKFELSHYILKI